MIRPSRLSAHLRSVAARIDASRAPSRSAVAAELRRVLTAMSEQGPAKVNMAIYDNTSVTPEEIFHEMQHGSPQGPIWAGLTGFGWLMVDRDPASMDETTPVEGGPFGEKTWGDMMKNDYVADGVDLKPYGSWKEFLANPDVIHFMASAEDDGPELLAQVLEDAGMHDLVEVARNMEI